MPSRSSRLAPWIAALRATGELALWRDASIVRATGLLWVQWPAIDALLDANDADADSSVALAHEALELFALLHAAGAYDAWGAFFCDVWPDDGPALLAKLPAWREGGVVVGCETSIYSPGNLETWWATYVVAAARDERAARLTNVLVDVFAIDAAASNRRWAVPVSLGICLSMPAHPEDPTQILVETARVATRQLVHDQQTGDPTRFVLQHIFPCEPIRTVDLAALSELSRCGVCIDFVAIFAGGLEWSSGSGTPYIPMLQNILGHPVAPRRAGVERLTINLTLGHAVAASVLSTLMDSQSIRELEVSTQDPSIAFNWLWLAVSVFSRHATHRIERLTVDMDDVQLEVVDAMQQILASPNPVASLYGVQRQSEAVAQASRFWIGGLPDGEADLIFSDEVAVRVIDDQQENWMDVILPGYGRASIARSDCQVMPMASPTTSMIRTVPSISLSWHSNSSCVAVARLLGIVGGNIRQLGLRGGHESEETIPVGWFEEVLRACPSLDALELEGLELENIIVAFAGFYEQGLTQVTKLTLKIDCTSAAQLTRFLEALTDDTKLITKTLTSLCVDVHINIDMAEDTEEEMEHAIQVALHDMLFCNYYLEHVEVSIEFETDEPTMVNVPSGVAAFRNYTGDAVYRRQGPLALNAKLAFLSCVLVDDARLVTMGRGEDPINQPMGKLDPHTLGRIFEFAAQSRTRHVSVMISN